MRVYYLHIDYTGEETVQSVVSKLPKAQFDTLGYTLEEWAVLRYIRENPSIKQTELADKTGKSLSTVKRITDALQEKKYILRVGGKRYGRWELLVQLH